MENFEEVYFGHKGNDYSVTIEVDENNDWRVMNVYQLKFQYYWEEMKVVPANVTKVQVAAIEEFLES